MTPLIALPAIARLDSVTGERVAAAAAELPELPALSALLHGAIRLSRSSNWRSGVLTALAVPEATAAVDVAVAARAIPVLPPGVGACLAMPVHAVAGLTRMFLATGDSFSLSAPERDALRVAFNAEFGAADVRLHAVGNGWVLQAPFAAAADDAPPELLIGAALSREPARTATGRMLRRLGAEVEMWLGGLSLNREREKRGVPPINSIWFWGGWPGGVVQAPQQLPGGVFSNAEPDAWLAGLASHCGMPVQRAMAWAAVRQTAGALVVLQPPLLGDALPQLQAWESGWFEPARQDLASRSLPALRLQIGRSAWQLPAPRLTRWLRRRRPWWQAVSA